ncbi:hypothetical protein [Ralstonia sp. 25mfcol4.1]|uniref:hypothetical protein n=1 Tax=Ralstonia sp. 25mfcol4.1 TaxID=1761899 RepID=UPI0020C8519B|nr:hypothetical protein [Ralstonia sp. 25mfcol4.1]
MAYKTVLVDLTDDGARQARLDAAFALAADSNGRVIGLSATGPMLDPYRSVGAETMRYQAMHADMLRGVEQAGTQALSDACARHGTPTDYSHVLAEQDAGWALATHGMASDIILPGLPGAPSELPVLMASAAEYALSTRAGRCWWCRPRRGCRRSIPRWWRGTAGARRLARFAMRCRCSSARIE